MSSQLKVYKNVSYVSAGNVLNAVLGFVFLTGVAKTLELDTFGKYALLTGLLTLFSRILDFGTNSLFVAAEKTPRTESTFVFSKVILFIFAIPLTLITLFFTGFNQPAIITIFLTGLASYGFSYLLYAFYQRDQKYLEIVLLNSIPSLIKGTFGILLYLGVIQLTLIQSFAVFGLSVVSCLVVPLLFPIKITLSEFDFGEIKNSLKKALSPGISQLIFESWQTVNNVLTKLFNTFSDVGVFSMANKISNIFSILSFSIFTVLLPHNKERNTENKKYDFKQSYLLGGMILVLSVVAIFGAQLFLKYTFDDKFKEASLFLDYLIFASAITAIQNFLENYFYVHNVTNYLVKINGSKLVILVGLALWGIPIFGLYFLAVANLVSALWGLGLTYGSIYRLEKHIINN